MSRPERWVDCDGGEYRIEQAEDTGGDLALMVDADDVFYTSGSLSDEQIRGIIRFGESRERQGRKFGRWDLQHEFRRLMDLEPPPGVEP